MVAGTVQAELGDGDAVEGGVDLPVPAAGEPVVVIVARPHRDWRGAVEPGVGVLGLEPLDAGRLAKNLGGRQNAASGDLQAGHRQVRLPQCCRSDRQRVDRIRVASCRPPLRASAISQAGTRSTASPLRSRSASRRRVRCRQSSSAHVRVDHRRAQATRPGSLCRRHRLGRQLPAHLIGNDEGVRAFMGVHTDHHHRFRRAIVIRISCRVGEVRQQTARRACLSRANAGSYQATPGRSAASSGRQDNGPGPVAGGSEKRAKPLDTPIITLTRRKLLSA